MNSNPNIPKCKTCEKLTNHWTNICLSCRKNLKTPTRKYKRKTKKEMKCSQT